MITCHRHVIISSYFLYNQFHNILRPFNVLPNFPFTTSEAMGDYYLHTWYLKLPHELPNDLRLGKLGNIRKAPKSHRMVVHHPAPLTAQQPFPLRQLFESL